MPAQTNINYVNKSHPEFHSQKHLLDVFYSEELSNSPVILFIHGGSWSGGSKEIYHKLGINLVEKGIATVILTTALHLK